MTTRRATRAISTMDTARRGNYESGSDYVLEYGELRFTFNERDFTERVEQAAAKLGFVSGSLGEHERAGPQRRIEPAGDAEADERSRAVGEQRVRGRERVRAADPRGAPARSFDRAQAARLALERGDEGGGRPRAQRSSSPSACKARARAHTGK